MDYGIVIGEIVVALFVFGIMSSIAVYRKGKAIQKFIADWKKGTAFHCQRFYEDKPPCDGQCDHCKEYYAPLEKLQ